MSTSKLPDVINYLVDTFTAAATLGAATPPVAVYDGPGSGSPGQVDQALFVGLDDPGIGGVTLGPVAATVSWRWGSLGAKSRLEQLGVPCVILCVDGGGSIRAARNLCLDVWARVDAVLVPSNIDLGGNAVYLTGLSQGTLRSDQFDMGAVAWMAFAVECETRI